MKEMKMSKMKKNRNKKIMGMEDTRKGILMLSRIGFKEVFHMLLIK